MQLITKENYDNKFGDTFIMLENEVINNKSLTSTDKIIYAIIKNKFKLSIQNNFMNKAGEYFVYFPQKELAEIVGCTEKAIYHSFARLEGKKVVKGKVIDSIVDTPLIKLNRDDTNTYRIFVYQLTGDFGKYEKKEFSKSSNDDDNSNSSQSKPVDKPVDNVGIDCGQQEVIVLDVEPLETPFDVYLAQADSEVEREQEHFSYGHVKITGNEELFTSRNKELLERPSKKKEIKKSNNKSIYLSSNTPSSNKIDDESKYRQVLSQFMNQIEYHHLLELVPDREILEDFCMSAVDMLMSDYTKIGGQDKPLAIIQSVMSRLTHLHMEDVIDRFCKLTDKIGNITGYMKTMLYNTGLNFKAQVDRTVMHDMYGVA